MTTKATGTDKTNEAILAERRARFEAFSRPAVGDFVALPRLHERLREWTRLTHDWGDRLQSGGLGGSYYLSESGHMSYSGCLDRGVWAWDLVGTDRRRNGSCWFFDGDIWGAGRAVYYSVACRVWELRAGADLEGIGELRCPFDLTRHETPVGCGYRWTVTQQMVAQTAFRTRAELDAWLASNQLECPVDPESGHYWQALRYRGTKSWEVRATA